MYGCDEAISKPITTASLKSILDLIIYGNLRRNNIFLLQVYIYNVAKIS